MRPLRKCALKINSVEVFFSAIHSVWTLSSCIYHECKDTFQNHSALSPCLFTFGLIGRPINGLVFFFAAFTEFQATVLSVLNLPWQGFPATCPIGHCYVCSPARLFASEIFCDLPTYNKQKMNKMSRSRWTCCLETQNARWRHVEWRL